MSDNKVIDVIVHCQKQFKKEKLPDDKLLHYLGRLSRLRITVQDLVDTGIGRTVNQLSRNEGSVGQAADTLVRRWKRMVSDQQNQVAKESDESDSNSGSSEEEEEEEEVNNPDETYGIGEQRESHEQLSNDQAPVEERRDSNEHQGREFEDDEQDDFEDIEDPYMSTNGYLDMSKVQNDEDDDEDDEEDNVDGNDSDVSDCLQIADDDPRHDTKDNVYPRQEKYQLNYSSPDEHKEHRNSQSKSSSSSHRPYENGDKRQSSSSKFHQNNNRHEKSHSHSSSSSKDLNSKESKHQHSNSRSHHGESKSRSSKSSESEYSVERKSHSSSSSSKSEKHKEPSRVENSEKLLYKDKDKYRDKSSRESLVLHRDKEGEKDKTNVHDNRKKEYSDSRSTQHNKEKYRDSTSSSHSLKKSSQESKKSDSHEERKRKDNSEPSGSSSSKKPKLVLKEEIDSTSGVNFADVLGSLDVPSKSKKSYKPDVEKSYKKSESHGSSSTPYKSESSRKHDSVPSSSKSFREGISSSKRSESDRDLEMTKQAKKSVHSKIESVIKPLVNISPNYKPTSSSLSTVARSSSNNGGSAMISQAELSDLATGDYLDNTSSKSSSAYTSQDDAISTMLSNRNKNARSKVYSGIKSGRKGEVPTLFDMCMQVIKDNIGDLGYTGGIPYDILRPALERANPLQLMNIEAQNDYLIGETDELWQFHCKRDFRGRCPDETESWRDLYDRCKDEQSRKFELVKKKMKKAIETAEPERKAKLAFVDTTCGPRFNKHKAQTIKNGMKTLKIKEEKGPKRGVASSASAGFNNPKASGDSKNVVVQEAAIIIAPESRAGHAPAPSVSRGESTAKLKPKKAPLMQKTMKLIRSLNRR